jgi:acetyl/propionyl-CoA carboxylase alpha subunit
MLKASAGGGGRGMRIVRNAGEFASEIKVARDEAMSGFGDDSMMVEKLIERPRHIEVQILADKHGNAAALFERECSIQRRHQKLIEESPTPLKGYESLWPSMRDAALKLVMASGYQNAGTVEFMVDESSNQFYFLEVNARLQVEHPVTETVTSVDLVKWQLRIASGEKLCLSDDLRDGKRTALNGHAIEARIVAEDPAKGFLPSAGKILAWLEPRIPNVRIDTGYGPGDEVPRHYDSLLAKVVAHGENREDATQKLEAALLDFHILGVPTNIGYLLDVLKHLGFRKGNFDTGFLEREFADWGPCFETPNELAAIASQATAAAEFQVNGHPSIGAWSVADDFRIGSRT